MQLKTTHSYNIILCGSVTWQQLWLWMSHEVAVEMSSGSLVIWRLDWVWMVTPPWAHVSVIRRLWFLLTVDGSPPFLPMKTFPQDRCCVLMSWQPTSHSELVSNPKEASCILCSSFIILMPSVLPYSVLTKYKPLFRVSKKLGSTFVWEEGPKIGEHILRPPCSPPPLCF